MKKSFTPTVTEFVVGVFHDGKPALQFRLEIGNPQNMTKEDKQAIAAALIEQLQFFCDSVTNVN